MSQQKFLEVESKIEAYRRALVDKDQAIEVIDFGAGSPDSNRSEEEMAQGVKVTTTTRSVAAVGIKGDRAKGIFEIVSKGEPKVILELGTCCGFSSSYLSHAAPNAQIYTIEGSPELAKIAIQTREDLGCSSVVQKVGKFVDVLPDLLPAIAPIDFVFIDGHHDREATLAYFRQILPFMASRGVMAFDDITWSEGMKEAWREILEAGVHQKSDDSFKIGILWL